MRRCTAYLLLFCMFFLVSCSAGGTTPEPEELQLVFRAKAEIMDSSGTYTCAVERSGPSLFTLEITAPDNYAGIRYIWSGEGFSMEYACLLYTSSQAKAGAICKAIPECQTEKRFAKSHPARSIRQCSQYCDFSGAGYSVPARLGQDELPLHSGRELALEAEKRPADAGNSGNAEKFGGHLWTV